jgi:ThiF family
MYSAKLSKSGDPLLCAVVKSVTDANGREVATWHSALPHALRGNRAREIEIPWHRSTEELRPKLQSQNPSMGLFELLTGRGNASSLIDFDQGSSMQGQLHAFLYPSETEFKRQGDTWLFVLAFGKRKAFYRGKKESLPIQPFVIRTLRGGRSDLTSRAPTLSGLLTKSVALIGTGALGAPLAIEFARNGIAELRLMDFDVVEPGNTVRWPLGTTTWGQFKSEALAKFIESEYPQTKTSFMNHCLGAPNPIGDSAALEVMLRDVDLVIDGTASFGTTTLIREEARSRSLPLLVLFASPSVAGGVVAVYAPDGGCPVCLEFAWQDESKIIAAPPGIFEEAELIQPPGCAERTFSGTFFDLQELSLQAMRAAAGLLTSDAKTWPSTVYTLTFQDEGGIRCPSWRKNVLLRHPHCSCHN